MVDQLLLEMSGMDQERHSSLAKGLRERDALLSQARQIEDGTARRPLLEPH